MRFFTTLPSYSFTHSRIQLLGKSKAPHLANIYRVNSLAVYRVNTKPSNYYSSTPYRSLSTRYFKRPPVVIGIATATIISGLLGGVYYYNKKNKVEPLADTLCPDDFSSLPLTSVQPLGENTFLFTFTLNKPFITSLTPIWSVFLKDDTMQTARHYTPVHLPLPGEPIRQLHLAIRVYADGQVSRFVASKRIGERIEFIGPRLNNYGWQYTANQHQHILMMAGGTGVAPMVQLLEYALMNDADTTRFTLIFAARNERDHLLSDTLDELARKHSSRLRVRYLAETVSAESRTTWTGGIGRITESDIVDASVWQTDESRASLVIVCGPPGMMEQMAGRMRSEVDPGLLGGLLAKIGYSTSQVIKL